MTLAVAGGGTGGAMGIGDAGAARVPAQTEGIDAETTARVVGVVRCDPGGVPDDPGGAGGAVAGVEPVEADGLGLMNGPAQMPELVGTLVANHLRFRAFLESRVGNVADAEDILQAAFLTSVEEGDTIRDGESAVAWFYRLLRNAVTDHYRHQDAERRALTRAASWSIDTDEVEPAVERAVCRCVMDLLPTVKADYADLLRRIDLDGASVAAVAAETGMTPNNVRVKLHRARVALRQRLEQSCGTCTEHGCLDCSCSRPSQPPA
jgi:RNA polymerase sigma-70 factor (ECF subfamily)